jgi:predicted nucleic acid-binding protein
VIVVDTSVWVDALRQRGSVTATRLSQLLDADDVALALPVRLELLAGVAARDRPALTRALTGLPVVVPGESTWASVERWTVHAARAGQRFALTDLLIAALAEDIGGLVWSLDEDFERMARLRLARLYD